jgi:excisionase family DNA binding protein
MTDSLLNIQQVADYLQLNQSTVYQWAQNGRLPAIKLGGRWRFRKADLDRWLDEQTRRPEALPSEARALSENQARLR